MTFSRIIASRTTLSSTHVLADTRSMRSHQVFLQMCEFLVRDVHLRENARTRYSRRTLPSPLGDRGRRTSSACGFGNPAPGVVPQMSTVSGPRPPMRREVRARSDQLSRRLPQSSSSALPARTFEHRQVAAPVRERTGDRNPRTRHRRGASRPLPGSFHRTRSIRLSAASLPSQTMTSPACCE